MIEVMQGELPAKMDSVMVLTSWNISLEKPFSGMGANWGQAESIPIRMKASHKRMFSKLPLSTRILLVV